MLCNLKSKHRRCIKLVHFWNPYDKTNNLTLFSEKSEHASINFDPCGTLKVKGGHFGNATCIWHIRKNVAFALFTLSTKVITLLTDTDTITPYFMGS